MTVATTTTKADFTGNGVTTLFAFPYPFIAATDIIAYINGVPTTAFAVSGSAPYPTGANITFTTAPTNGAVILLVRIRPFTQTLDLVPNDPLPADQVELLLGDHLVMLCQQLQEITSRSFALAITDTSGASTVIPTPIPNKALLWNSNGTALINSIDDFESIVTNATAAAAAAAASATAAGTSASSASTSATAAAANASTILTQLANASDFYCGTSTGTTTKALTTGFNLTTLVPGMKFRFIVNSTAVVSSISVDGLANVTTRKFNGVNLVNLVSGDLTATCEVEFIYDGSFMQLVYVRPHAIGAAIASAATVNLSIATGDYVSLTGSVNITAITLAQGLQITVNVATGGMTLTASAALILPFGVSSLTLAAGDVFTVFGVTTGVLIPEINRAAVATARADLGVSTVTLQGDFANLAGKWLTNTTAQWTANQIVLQNSSQSPFLALSPSVTLNTALSAVVNGLDTGTLANNTWYNVFMIYNGTTVGALMSLSASAPTLPSGYTFFARVGSVRIDSSGHIIGFQQFNRSVQYVVGNNCASMPLLAVGPQGTFSSSAPTRVSVSWSAFAPPTAAKLKLFVTAVYNGGGPTFGDVTPNNNYSGSTTTNAPPLSTFSANGAVGISVLGDIVPESSNLFTVLANSNGALQILGWEDNL